MSRPDYRVTPELLAITDAAKAKSGLARRLFKTDVEIYRAYQRVFFADGQLTREARIVIEDMADSAGIGKAAAGLEHEELACLEGRRRLFLHMMGRFELSPARVENLKRQMSEEEDR